MSTYFMFGKYSPQAIQGISKGRTGEIASTVSECGGEVKDIYTLLSSEHDVLIIADLPGTKEAMTASVKLGQLTGIAFSSAPALTAEEFDSAVG